MSKKKVKIRKMGISDTIYSSQLFNIEKNKSLYSIESPNKDILILSNSKKELKNKKTVIKQLFQQSPKKCDCIVDKKENLKKDVKENEISVIQNVVDYYIDEKRMSSLKEKLIDVPNNSYVIFPEFIDCRGADFNIPVFRISDKDTSHRLSEITYQFTICAKSIGETIEEAQHGDAVITDIDILTGAGGMTYLKYARKYLGNNKNISNKSVMCVRANNVITSKFNQVKLKISRDKYNPSSLNTITIEELCEYTKRTMITRFMFKSSLLYPEINPVYLTQGGDNIDKESDSNE